MLSGEKLGQALKEAMRLKKVTQAQVGKEFGIAQPSVSNWLKTGRIDKTHIEHLLTYFSDVVGPEHWGLSAASTSTSPVAIPAGHRISTGECAQMLVDQVAKLPEPTARFVSDIVSLSLTKGQLDPVFRAHIDSVAGDAPVMVLIDEPETHLHPAPAGVVEWVDTLRSMVENWEPHEERDFLLGVLEAADKATGMKIALRSANSAAIRAEAKVG